MPIITRNTATGELIASNDPYERDEQLGAAGWADADCEDVSDHPVYAAQLRAVYQNDMNGYCVLTDHIFTADELAATAMAHITHGSPVTDEEMAQENARVLAQHTPGPWSFTVSAESGGNPSAWNIIAPCGGVVAETGSGTDDANARLIAAAPELLAALQNILAANPDLAEVADEARAAIAKATGGAQ